MINTQKLLFQHYFFFRRLNNNAELTVNVSSTINCRLGNKSKTIAIEGVSGIDTPSFKHSGSFIIFEVPSSYCNSI